MRWKISRSKMKNSPTERDGMKFASGLEARYYDFLIQLKNQGEVSFFLRQCPIHLIAGVKYIVDFIVFYTSGEVEFVDVKGMKTAMYTLKKKQVECMYPLEIKEITNRDF